METIGITKLNKTFGAHATAVLCDHIKQVETPRGSPRKFEVVKPLPTVEEYAKLRLAKYTTSVTGLAEDAFGAIECLKDELQDWFDNLPESFQQGQKGDELQEAISTLESVEQIDAPDCLAEHTTCFLPSLKIESRSDRAGEAASQLREVVEYCEGLLEGENSGLTDDQKQEVEEYKDGCDNACQEIENVSFPGMY